MIRVDAESVLIAGFGLLELALVLENASFLQVDQNLERTRLKCGFLRLHSPGTNANMTWDGMKIFLGNRARHL